MCQRYTMRLHQQHELHTLHALTIRTQNRTLTCCYLCMFDILILCSRTSCGTRINSGITVNVNRTGRSSTTECDDEFVGSSATPSEAPPFSVCYYERAFEVSQSNNMLAWVSTEKWSGRDEYNDDDNGEATWIAVCDRWCSQHDRKRRDSWGCDSGLVCWKNDRSEKPNVLFVLPEYSF